jgi:hypothetical protein
MPSTAVSRRLLRGCTVALLALLALCSRVRTESRARLRYGPKTGVLFHKLPERFVQSGLNAAPVCMRLAQVGLMKHKCLLCLPHAVFGVHILIGRGCGEELLSMH